MAFWTLHSPHSFHRPRVTKLVTRTGANRFEDTVGRNTTNRSTFRNPMHRYSKGKIANSPNRMDVFESTKDHKVIATIELPGMKKEDVILDIHNNRLIIHGKYPSHNEEEKDGYIMHERCEGKFTRVLPLSVGVKADQIKASMENGVLQVTFPKPSPEQKASRITIS